VFLVFLWGSITSCGFVADQDEGRSLIVEQSVSSLQSPERASETFPRELAAKYPNFAGYYCEEGDLHIGLTSSASSAQISMEIEAEGTAFFCRNRAYPDKIPSVRISQDKTYSFAQLVSWRDKVYSDLVQRSDGRGLGIDYAQNRVLVDVELGATASTRQRLASMGLPSDAVVVAERAGAKPSACSPYPTAPLTNCFRPVPGGVQVAAAAMGQCSVAFGGYHPSTGELGWVTASHCLGTNEFGQVTGRYVYQYNNLDLGQLVASESLDPATTTCVGGGTIQSRCRYSDSTWLRHEAGGVQRGQIVQTLSSNGTATCCGDSPTCGACVTSTASPRFQILGSASPVQGMQVEKVGRTSGWTTGTVSQTCHDGPDGEGRWLICQTISSNLSNGGDSGGPLFYWWWFYGVNTIQIVGVYWGRDTGIAYSSPWSGVSTDLGSIDIKFTPQWQNLTALYSEYAHDVGVGGGATFIVSNTPASGGYIIKRWNGAGWNAYPTPGFVRVAVDPNGAPWAVTNAGAIYRWVGSWQLLPGSAQDIAIGANGSVYVIGTAPSDGNIYIWNGSNWSIQSGLGLRIAVDPQGNPWIRASDTTIWRRTNGVWSQMPGAALDITISHDGMPWVIGTTNGIHWWSGQSWVQVPGVASVIAADKGGIPWVVNSANQVFRGL